MDVYMITERAASSHVSFMQCAHCIISINEPQSARFPRAQCNNGTEASNNGTEASNNGTEESEQVRTS